ncbi:hypothetical protein F4859DRAFT_484873 [Xylaria cf. heliscus]|nr:hypothetical protein F4859DRAFT_484873 [Xylaria cf. heliscus]
MVAWRWWPSRVLVFFFLLFTGSCFQRPWRRYHFSYITGYSEESIIAIICITSLLSVIRKGRYHGIQ